MMTLQWDSDLIQVAAQKAEAKKSSYKGIYQKLMSDEEEESDGDNNETSDGNATSDDDVSCVTYI